ncbi:MAG: restriction endonuclease subunit S [Spirochaetes bacterium]|nr:restriction endonuclease subunit S [Spirochaetota bacterium]
MNKDWKREKLGNVCDVLDNRRKPITKRNRIPGEFPYYGATGILDYVHAYIFDEKLILIGEDGAKWQSGENTAFIVEGKYWVNNHAHVIRPNRDMLLDDWLVYFLNFSDLLPYIAGLTVPKLTQAKLREIIFPLPPLSEQQLIVSILDKAFASINKAKENAAKNLANAREFFESYLQSVFTNPGGGWGEKVLNEICDVKDGTHDSPKYIREGIPFVTQKNIRTEGLSFADTKFITEEDHNKFYKRSNVVFGDILISMIGANRGMVCIVDDKRTFSIKNVGLIKSNAKINTQYLLYFLKSPIAMQYVKYMSNGGAQEFVGLTALRRFPIPGPNLSEQNLIVTKLDALFTETKKLETIYQQKLADLNELKKSILQKAFNGKLKGN